MDSLLNSSDESSVEAVSTGPTTPNWSPYLFPQTASPDFDSRVSEGRASTGSSNIGPAAIQDRSVRNVCVIGAGYVGKEAIAIKLSKALA
jgi:hypothetical protein